jgi:thiol-disulfide isomerase/thioredoxin
MMRIALAVSLIASVLVTTGVRAEPRGSDEVTVNVASWKQTQEIVAKHKGKVVVLDLWSTWCQPCVKEFPHLVELQRANPDDLVCISLNCNYIGDGKPEDEKPEVLKFLMGKKAAIVNLISSDPDEELYKQVGIASIPVVQVYNSKGRLAKQFDNEKDEYGKNGFSYQKDIEPYVQQLLSRERQLCK